MSEGGERGLARFLRAVGRLKFTPRTGWRDRGIPPIEVESVADHTFRTALIAWLLAFEDPSLDQNRVLLLALVHDLAESLTGDFPPYESSDIPAGDPAAFFNRRQLPSQRQAERKRAAEADAMAQLVAMLPPLAAASLRDAWREIEARATPEARFVKGADRLEAYLQSREYAERVPGLPVASFAAEVAETIDHPAQLRLRDAIGRKASDDV